MASRAAKGANVEVRFKGTPYKPEFMFETFLNVRCPVLLNMTQSSLYNSFVTRCKKCKIGTDFTFLAWLTKKII